MQHIYQTRGGHSYTAEEVAVSKKRDIWQAVMIGKLIILWLELCFWAHHANRFALHHPALSSTSVGRLNYCWWIKATDALQFDTLDSMVNAQHVCFEMQFDLCSVMTNKLLAIAHARVWLSYVYLIWQSDIRFTKHYYTCRHMFSTERITSCVCVFSVRNFFVRNVHEIPCKIVSLFSNSNNVQLNSDVC